MRTLILCTILILQSLSLIAQEISDQTWATEEDFRSDETSILKNITWLEENPMASDVNDTKEITAYVLNWLSNSPYITVVYDEVFLMGLANNKKYKFGEKFRVTYLFGKSYYVLLNPKPPNEVKASARGIAGMVQVYQELKKMDPSVRHKLLEKYSRMEKKDKLESYTETLLNRPLQ